MFRSGFGRKGPGNSIEVQRQINGNSPATVIARIVVTVAVAVVVAARVTSAVPAGPPCLPPLPTTVRPPLAIMLASPIIADRHHHRRRPFAGRRLALAPVSAQKSARRSAVRRKLWPNLWPSGLRRAFYHHGASIIVIVIAVTAAVPLAFVTTAPILNKRPTLNVALAVVVFAKKYRQTARVSRRCWMSCSNSYSRIGFPPRPRWSSWSQ